MGILSSFVSRFTRWRTNRKRIADRLLLAYWDGTQNRYGDPHTIYKTIANWPDLNLERDLAAIDADDWEAADRLLAATRAAFGVKPWDDKTLTGLTHAETLGLFSLLCRYLNGVKKNTNFGPTSPQTGASNASIGQVVPDEPTKPSSDSGSTVTEPASAAAGG